MNDKCGLALLTKSHLSTLTEKRRERERERDRERGREIKGEGERERERKERESERELQRLISRASISDDFLAPHIYRGVSGTD